MDKVHPNQDELAWLSELGDDGEEEVALEHVAHLQWCTRCRSVVSEYRWLQNEVTGTLAVAANAVRVPRPRWWEIERSLLIATRRGTRGWRLSAVASVVSVATAPLLDTVEDIDDHLDSGLSSVVTPTPSTLPVCESTPLPTPALALPPTPVLPEACGLEH